MAEEEDDFEDLAIRLCNNADDALGVARAQVYATLVLAASVREAAAELAETFLVAFDDPEEEETP